MGSGLSSTPYTALKMALLAPIASANVSVVARAYAGDFVSSRAISRTS